MTEHRDQQIHFRVSKVELERIRQKMESCGILSIGSYLRKMALDGYCLNLDLPQLRRMAYLLQNCSNNLNQVAKRAIPSPALLPLRGNRVPPQRTLAGETPLVRRSAVHANSFPATSSAASITLSIS